MDYRYLNAKRTLCVMPFFETYLVTSELLNKVPSNLTMLVLAIY